MRPTGSSGDEFTAAHRQPNNRSHRLLVVDDEAITRAVLAQVLTERGFEVAEANTGLEAMRMLKNSDFDMVLLDIVMPELDGFGVLTAIRQKFSHAELPVIMVSATEETTQLVRAFDQGANDYIIKPVDYDVAAARINMHLQFKSSQAALKRSEQRHALIARGTNDGLWDWDLDQNKIYYSNRWMEMLGVSNTIANCPSVWMERIHEEDRPRVEANINRHLLQQTPHFETELRMRHADGSFRWMLCRGLAVWDDQGIAHRMAGSLTDITEGKVADALTGLPNRVLFHERLARCFEKKQTHDRFEFALLYLDLDNFKLVNDSLGHDAGDRLLVAVARRLETVLRESDSFASRLGGDEFAILVEGIESVDDAEQVARRIIAAVNTPILLQGREVFASTSVGICTSFDGDTVADDMVQAADMSMYAAKKEGKACYRVFDPAMRGKVRRRLEIQNALRRAVDSNELRLHFQPIVEMQTGRLTGFEALVRWTHPELGPISPADFIPIAEDNGLIIPMGKQILRLACEQMAQWKQSDARFENLRISVNLSSRQLCAPKLVDDVLEILSDTQLDPSHLRLEVTESSIMQNPKRGAAVLSQLRSHGVKVAIDDFGTGYSSLAYIHELCPDVVKIDRSFVDKITTSSDKATIVGAITMLADGLNFDVVAEGVETTAQRKLLASMGCVYAQGYLFSRPLSPNELAIHLNRSQNIRCDQNHDAELPILF